MRRSSSRSWRRAALVLAVLSLALGVPARAMPRTTDTASDDPDGPLRMALRATCSVPDGDQMRALHPDAPRRLFAMAMRSDEEDYVRLRAVSLLSFFPSDETEAWLDVLMEVGPLRQRALAVYTFARTFGDLTPELVLARIEPFLDAAEERLRTSAVRGMGWVAGEAARTRLRALAAQTSEPAVRALVTHVLQTRVRRP